MIDNYAEKRRKHDLWMLADAVQQATFDFRNGGDARAYQKWLKKSDSFAWQSRLPGADPQYIKQANKAVESIRKIIGADR